MNSFAFNILALSILFTCTVGRLSCKHSRAIDSALRVTHTDVAHRTFGTLSNSGFGLYMYGLLKPGKILSDVRKFVNHDEVHMLLDYPRSAVLVYMQGHDAWIHDHFLRSSSAFQHLLWTERSSFLSPEFDPSSNCTSMRGSTNVVIVLSTVEVQRLEAIAVVRDVVVRWSNSDSGCTAAVRQHKRATVTVLLNHSSTPAQCSCRELLLQLASLSFVRYVDVATPFFVQNNVATSTMQDPVTGKHTVWENGITGEGQIVAVGDTGVDFDSCFFRDDSTPVSFFPQKNPSHRKILSYQQCTDEGVDPDHGDLYGAHGTHVAGSVAGNSLSANAEYNGMAKDAKLFFQDLTCKGQSGLLLPPNLEDYYEPAFEVGARVSSNSWGSDGSPSTYTATDRFNDMFLYNHQDFLSVFAAGNVGTAGVLSPASSKNVLTVASHKNSQDRRSRDQISGFSGRGPTFDQRIKPEIAAPGESVMSALSDGVENSNQCSVTAKSGTSMATPHVAGAAVLLRQYLKEGLYPTAQRNSSNAISSPSSSLMKALLIQAAVRMSNDAPVTPNGVQGFGRLELPLLLHFAHPPSIFRALFDKRNVRTGETHSYCFVFSKGTTSLDLTYLKATLAWTDSAAAHEGSSKTLVNDLDLVAVGTNGEMVRGNRRSDGTLNIFDRHNNVEQVSISMSELGDKFCILVHGFDVPDTQAYGGQPYSLVVWGPAGLRETGTTLDSCPNGCSGIGECFNGVCKCPETHHHVDCSACNATKVCAANGVCNFEKQCTCFSQNFDTSKASDCTVCSSGWFGPQCDNDCKCSGHGTCDVGGMCTCVSPSPVSSSCFDGADCRYCCRDYGGEMCDSPSFWCENRGLRVIDTTRQLVPSTGLIEINGYGQYRNADLCRWSILANGTITITFLSFAIEDPYDYVRVYDGDLASGKELERFTGTKALGKSITVTSGVLSISFFADMVGTDKGFVIKYEVVNTVKINTTVAPSTTPPVVSEPPSTSSPTVTPVPATVECSFAVSCEHEGVCDASTSTCRCASPYVGWRCRETCPVGFDYFNHAVVCNGRGRCVSSTQCIGCEDSYSGNACQLHLPSLRNGHLIDLAAAPYFLGAVLPIPVNTSYVIDIALSNFAASEQLTPLFVSLNISLPRDSDLRAAVVKNNAVAVRLWLHRHSTDTLESSFQVWPSFSFVDTTKLATFEESRRCVEVAAIPDDNSTNLVAFVAAVIVSSNEIASAKHHGVSKYTLVVELLQPSHPTDFSHFCGNDDAFVANYLAAGNSRTTITATAESTAEIITEIVNISIVDGVKASARDGNGIIRSMLIGALIAVGLVVSLLTLHLWRHRGFAMLQLHRHSIEDGADESEMTTESDIENKQDEVTTAGKADGDQSSSDEFPVGVNGVVENK